MMGCPPRREEEYNAMEDEADQSAAVETQFTAFAKTLIAPSILFLGAVIFKDGYQVLVAAGVSGVVGGFLGSRGKRIVVLMREIDQSNDYGVAAQYEYGVDAGKKGILWGTPVGIAAHIFCDLLAKISLVRDAYTERD